MALSFCNTEINEQGKELIEHGTVLFPIACYNDNLNEGCVPWHWHDELETIIVTEGTAIIAAGTNKYVVNEGEGIFINAGILHAAWSKDYSLCKYHSITFHPRLIGGSMDSVYWQKYIQPLITNSLLKAVYFDGSESWHKNAIINIETAWQSCVNEPLGYEFLVRNELSQLILHLASYHPATTNRPSEKSIRNSNRIKLMLQFIHDHYSEPINTSMIASSAMISESECLRCFKNIIGIPPIQYLKQFRIEKAAELLSSTNDTIIKIGAQCGFQDTSYFVKIFKEKMNCTPSKYRKINPRKSNY